MKGNRLNTIARNTIFLLGGHDLEMLTIKDLLVKYGYVEDENYFDKNLKWGAKLSSYEKVLKEHPDKPIYGIELKEDIAPPSNYIAIDHHNEKSSNPSSLEQVVTLLGLELSHYEQLVAQNDIGHIEAMRCFGATDEEIREIRQKERSIQGVTKVEEEIAQKEIHFIKKENGIYILETSLDTFSAIVDRFEKRPFLLYSKKSLTYYGDITFLTKAYTEQIKQCKAYHGRGYFGFDSEYLEKNNMENLVREIIEVKEEKKKIVSYHNFMFPFRFDKIVESIKDKHEYYRNHDFDDRVKIDPKLKDTLEENEWEYQKYEVKNSLDYNEIVYFHDFVKDSLFNTENFNEGATSYYFEKKLEEDASFEIKIKDRESYLLKLEGVNLRLFDTGVGILSFELENYNYFKTDDILKINDYGRRIYPQFLGDEFSTEATREAFLPEYIKVNGVEEHFCDVYKDISIAKYITDILGETFTTKKNREGQYYLQPIIDDRMFVLSWYENSQLTSCTQKSINTKDWYRYVFVDGNDITVQDEKMHHKLIEKSTYQRWNNYGTFYGITRYSFVCLSSNDFPLNHMKTMYFQMFSLLLVQRASILRFSDEITAISDIRDAKPSTEKISILYKNYLRFVNKLYFKEVTAQDQGIEIYDKALDILNIKRDVEDLRQEIGTLNGYAFLEQEREEKEQMNKLSMIGYYLIPPTLVAGLFGMNVFPDHSIDNVVWTIISIVAMIASSGLGYYLLKRNDEKSKEKK